MQSLSSTEQRVRRKISIPDEFSKDNIALFTKKKSSKGQNVWDRFNNQKMKSNKWPHVQRVKKIRQRKGWKRADPMWWKNIVIRGVIWSVPKVPNNAAL